MVDTHIRINEIVYKQIKNKVKQNNTSFNKECNRLLELSLTSEKLLLYLNDIFKVINNVDKNCYIIKRLLEQTYSDIGLSVTDVNNSPNLKCFYKKMKGKYFNE